MQHLQLGLNLQILRRLLQYLQPGPNLQILRRLLQHLQLGPNLQILLRGSSQTAAVSSGSAVGRHP